jgi:hypothetical protein
MKNIGRREGNWGKGRDEQEGGAEGETRRGRKGRRVTREESKMTREQSTGDYDQRLS